MTHHDAHDRELLATADRLVGRARIGNLAGVHRGDGTSADYLSTTRGYVKVSDTATDPARSRRARRS